MQFILTGRISFNIFPVQGDVEIEGQLQRIYPSNKGHYRHKPTGLLKENRRSQERNCHCALDKQTFARNAYIDHQY